MFRPLLQRMARLGLGSLVTALVLAGAVTSVQARITRIVVDSTTDADTSKEPAGAAGPVKVLSGRAFGELDPGDPHNAIIQDISLAPRNRRGNVEYMATFQLSLPADPSKISGLMWHDVPNRGRRFPIAAAERHAGDVGLSSGWQGDNSGTTAHGTPGADYVVLPVAINPDGSSVTGKVLGRIVNRSGPHSQPILVQSSPIPYKPASLDTSQATLTVHTHETVDGKITKGPTIAPEDWAWARCDADNPFPGVPDATQICLKHGFDSALLYQVVYTAKDPYVLGIGFAAFRDMASFFKYESVDDAGTANPVAGHIKSVIARGISQSGNFLRGFLHLGFNQDTKGRMVHDGHWPIIAGRRIALNFRWAQPDGVLELYQAGSEGPQWWTPYPDPVRGLPARGILDRCTLTKTCPKIIEHFGSAEVWALKLTPEWIGTDAREDIPLPPNVRRYYIASSTHGGGVGGFNTSLPDTLLPPPSCPGNNFGTGVLNANPLPHEQTVNALREHFRNWVMNNTEPPPSRYPMLRNAKGEADLVDPNPQAMGFPRLPSIPPEIPGQFIMPVLDYDWGPEFDPNDGSGVPTLIPPPIKRVIATKVPRVNADGNEVGGVPVVLQDAPLGTYLGWNITARGPRPFHQGQICNYVGGMIPFARSKPERLVNDDPRLSLEERYGNHAGYVEAVKAAAAKAVSEGFLLKADADMLINRAQASQVLKD